MNLTLLRPLPSGAGSVSQWFDERPQVYRQFGVAGHDGLDYAAPLGTSILATHDGVCQVGWDAKGYGNWVRVVGPWFGGSYRLITLYAHATKLLVEANQEVKAGDTLALVGSTGFSTGPHLHWAVKIEGISNAAYRNWLNPLLFRI